MLQLTNRDNLEIDSSIKKCLKRKKNWFNGEYHHLAIARSNRFLRKHDSEKMKMFVLFVDLGGSTRISSELTPEVLNKIIRLYSQEMAYVIEDYCGYVLKYVGDAVIGYFPVHRTSSASAEKTILCAQTMMSIIENVINPVIRQVGILVSKSK